MMERVIEIPIEEYQELLRIAERVKVAERICHAHITLYPEECAAIFGWELKEQDKDDNE